MVPEIHDLLQQLRQSAHEACTASAATDQPALNAVESDPIL